MTEERKKYRKSFISSGQIYIAGELLEFESYNISVAGICVEVVPGEFLTEISDFEALLKETSLAEIYVKDLMLTGEVEIVWVNQEKESIQLGLEFKDVNYNADKLWLVRRFYRSKKAFTGHLITSEKNIEFQGRDISTDGLSLQFESGNTTFKSGELIKLIVNEYDIKGIGKIVWVDSKDEKHTIMGLRYFKSE